MSYTWQTGELITAEKLNNTGTDGGSTDIFYVQFYLDENNVLCCNHTQEELTDVFNSVVDEDTEKAVMIWNENGKTGIATYSNGFLFADTTDISYGYLPIYCYVVNNDDSVSKTQYNINLTSVTPA